MKPVKAWAIKDKRGVMEIYTDASREDANFMADQRCDECAVVRVEIREVAPKPGKKR